jgi:hypothetical protein
MTSRLLDNTHSVGWLSYVTRRQMLHSMKATTGTTRPNRQHSLWHLSCPDCMPAQWLQKSRDALQNITAANTAAPTTRAGLRQCIWPGRVLLLVTCLTV